MSLVNNESGPEEAHVAELKRHVLGYLIDNPGARDTMEGLSQWWILQQSIEQESARVRKAVEQLVAEGLLLESAGPDGRAHFQVNPQAESTILDLLGSE